MSVSSRTPEGFPSHCPLCGAETKLEYSDPAEDAPCPNCGYLLWKSGQVLRFTIKRLTETRIVPSEGITADSLFEHLHNGDSLDFVEFLMELEDEFGVVIPDAKYEEIRTVGDLVRYVIQRQTENSL